MESILEATYIFVALAKISPQSLREIEQFIHLMTKIVMFLFVLTKMHMTV